MRIDRIKLIAEMARQDITAKDLSKKCGVSRATISNVKNGKSCIDSVGNAIANGLGVDVADLLED